ncbi:MAG: glycoside hydrolase family 92 protein, partial [Chitinivibrionia bacterium]|nr:glycoside hydrolase family 92 protein [Chitinivibrionia bacterium]
MPNILRALIAVLFLGAGDASAAPERAAFVDPFIGTGGHGHTYPGASLPFGMVQLSPDTRLAGWDGCSGYHYSDSTLYGFSHTHLSGTGCPDYCDILLMPTSGEARLAPGDASIPGSGYRSRFRHATERAKPGYYGVHLDDYDIDVELTVSRRAGFHRYRFRRAEQANVIIDLAHRDPVIDSSIRFAGDAEIEGHRISRAWAREQHVYFVARFSRPFDRRGIALGSQAPVDLERASGDSVRAFVSFNGAPDEVLVKVGLSAVSIDGARKNLESEIPGWDFDAVRKDAGRI